MLWHNRDSNPAPTKPQCIALTNIRLRLLCCRYLHKSMYDISDFFANQLNHVKKEFIQNHSSDNLLRFRWFFFALKQNKISYNATSGEVYICRDPRKNTYARKQCATYPRCWKRFSFEKYFLKCFGILRWTILHRRLYAC